MRELEVGLAPVRLLGTGPAGDIEWITLYI